MGMSLILTGSSLNGVLGVSPSCHFAFLEYMDVYNSIANSVVCLVLRGTAKLDLSCNCVERKGLLIGVGLYLLVFYVWVCQSAGSVVVACV